MCHLRQDIYGHIGRPQDPPPIGCGAPSHRQAPVSASTPIPRLASLLDARIRSLVAITLQFFLRPGRPNFTTRYHRIFPLLPRYPLLLPTFFYQPLGMEIHQPHPPQLSPPRTHLISQPRFRTSPHPASNSSNSPNSRCTRPHRQNPRPVPLLPSDDTKRRIVPNRQQSRPTPRFPPQPQTPQHGRLSRRSALRDQRHTGTSYPTDHRMLQALRHGGRNGLFPGDGEYRGGLPVSKVEANGSCDGEEEHMRLVVSRGGTVAFVAGESHGATGGMAD